ncbi:hypothetical protein FJR45_06420 [Sulfurimonas sediminis]|uniref:Lipoprotein n=1 Tax=Sulfurimonas sediminis TaxID=2590020 RepID=A0A7M1B1K1_9BACT|nr:hypothetical protein [Sulfurimonas sediminis]QOP43603.1 hypothetical protein FJR45_06420 [Sulfurimonas sediminis]
MKFLLPILLLLLTFLGCAQKNAFERFHLKNSQELAEDNLQSSKIVNTKAEVVAIVTAVYLNKTDPKIYKDYEYFYLYLYKKNKKSKVEFYLNDTPAILVEKLPVQNEFTALTSFHAKWNKYYLVGFTKQKKDTLHLKIQLGQNSTILTFKH